MISALVLLAASHGATVGVDSDISLAEHALHCFDVSDGLPHGTVTDLAMAPDGRLVVATYGGVAFFDGHRFSDLLEGFTRRLPKLEASAVAVDSVGDLWVGTTTRGVYRFGVDGDAHWEWNDTERFVGNDAVQLAAGPRGMLVLTDINPAVIPKDESLAPIVSPQTLHSNRFNAAWSDVEGRFVVGSRSGIWRHLGDGRWEQLLRGPPSGFHAGATVADQETGVLTVYLASALALHRWNGQDLETLTTWDEPLQVQRMVVDASGDVWFGTVDHGLLRWGSRGLESLDLLPSRHVQGLSLDDRGQLWAGTARGLCRVSSAAVRGIDRRRGFTFSSIAQVADDPQGRVFAAARSNSLKLGMIDGNVASTVDLSGTIGGYRIDAIAPGDDALWVASNTELMRHREGRWESIAQLNAPFRSLLVASSGDVWAGAPDSLIYRFDGDLWQPITNDDRFTGTADALVESPRGTIYAAGDGGLFEIDLDGTMSRVETAPAHATCALAERNGELWVCSSGLTLITPGETYRFGAAHGLTDGHTHAVVEDEFGAVWVTSNSGLFRITRRTLQGVLEGEPPEGPLFQRFDERDGLLSSEFNGGMRGAIRTADGRLWFAGLGGVSVVDPKRLDETRQQLQLRIEETLADGGLIELGSEPLTEKPGLLRIHFGAVALADAASLDFRYRLLPLHETWEQSPQRIADYRRLPPGRYEFQVSARYGSGSWVEPVSRSLVVPAAFYEKPWVQRGFALACAALLVAVPMWRIRQLRQREASLEELVASRTESLKTANAALEALSNTDQLTGISNRREFEARIEALMSAPEPVTLALLDVDDFKAFNDSHGHPAGDRCLVTTAELLAGAVSEEVVVARYGGEEFVLAWPAGPERARADLERFRHALANAAIPHRGATHRDVVTVSAGVATGATGEGPESLLVRADRALYVAKAGGKDRIEFAAQDDLPDAEPIGAAGESSSD
ncbi:MAG: diguanylate cyclase [Pseudomonadota bacterium]